jgi:hypothetical protein
MANPLVPEARPDKDGKVVTRWVKVLETGEPAIPIPAPKAPDQKILSESLFAKMYVDIDENTGYLIDACGREVYYTYEFTEHVLGLLPTPTLRSISKHLTDGTGSEQSFLMMPLFAYVDSMYERENDDRVEEIMETGVTRINNALVFHGALSTIDSRTNQMRMAEDYLYILNSTLEMHEGTRSQRETDFEEHVSSIDYSKVPKQQRDQAIGFITASCLTYSFTDEHRRVPSPEAVDFVASRIDDLQRIVDIAAERTFEDIEVIRRVLESPVAALSDGAL